MLVEREGVAIALKRKRRALGAEPEAARREGMAGRKIHSHTDGHFSLCKARINVKFNHKDYLIDMYM
jgi:hypothetical protein